MPHDVTTGSAPRASVVDRPGRRLLAPPSRRGILTCAASLMPAQLFLLLGLSQLVAAILLWQGHLDGHPRGHLAAWLEIGHLALTVVISFVVGWLFLIRRPSAQPRGAGGRLADWIAVGGTALALIPWAAPRRANHELEVAAGDALVTVGLVVIVLGILSLGRSFGIMPRARGLVRSGLYRWVRHPIYVGELIATSGLLLLALGPLGLVGSVLLGVVHGYRATQEERTLQATYPEYAQYRASTARLLPGVY